MAHKQRESNGATEELKKEISNHVKENGASTERKQPAGTALSESEIYRQLEAISGPSDTRIKAAIMSDLNNINKWLKLKSHGGLDKLKTRLDGITELVKENNVGNKEIEIALLHATARLYLMKAQSREALSFEKQEWLDSDNLPKDDDFLELLTEYYKKDFELLQKEMPAFNPKGITFLQWQEEKNPQIEFARRYLHTWPEVFKLVSRSQPMYVNIEKIGVYLSSLGLKVPETTKTGFSDSKIFSSLDRSMINRYSNPEPLLQSLGRLLYAYPKSRYLAHPSVPVLSIFAGYQDLQSNVYLAFCCLPTTPRKMALLRAAIEDKSSNSLSSFLTDETRKALKVDYEEEVAEAKKDMVRAETIQADLQAVESEDILLTLVKSRSIRMLNSDDDYHRLFFGYFMSVLKGDRAIPLPVRDCYLGCSQEKVYLKLIDRVKPWLKFGDPFLAILTEQHQVIKAPMLERLEADLAKKEARVARLEARNEGAAHITNLIKKNRFEQAIIQMLQGDPQEVVSTAKLNKYINEVFDATKALPDNIATEITAEKKGATSAGGSTRMMVLSDPNSPKTRLALAVKLIPCFAVGSTVGETLKTHRSLLKMKIKQEGDKRSAMLSEREFYELSNLPQTTTQPRAALPESVEASSPSTPRRNSQ